MEQIAADNHAPGASHGKTPGAKNVGQVVSDIKTTSAAQEKGTAQILKTLPRSKIAFATPMQCRLVKSLPKGEKWIYEIKFDGFRALALKRGKEVELLSRSAKDLTARFPEIAAAVGKLPMQNGVLDGEIVAVDEKGRSSFQLLQRANLPGAARAPICFYVFDLLNLEGKNLADLRLTQRKDLLQNLIQPAHEPIRFSADIKGDSKKLLAEIRRLGLEGIIAKRVDSNYEAGLGTGSWSKIKVINAQEFVIGGYTAPKGSRDFFGAILVGYFENERFLFASKVGSGFNQILLSALNQEFQKIRRDRCPFINLPEQRFRHSDHGVTAAEMKRCTWVEPKLVCQIQFSEWTRDGHLRQPVFIGLREDIKPRDVVKEVVAE